MKMGLADLGNIALAGSISSVGFGSLEKKMFQKEILKSHKDITFQVQLNWVSFFRKNQI